MVAIGHDYQAITLSRWSAMAVVFYVIALGGCAETNKPLGKLLGALRSMTPAEAARQAFDLYDADKRRQGVTALDAAPFGGEEAYVRMYRVLVDDDDPTVRAACIKALGRHGNVEDAQILIDAISNPAEMSIVRWEAAKALGMIHNPIAISPLCAAANTHKEEADADVRMAAAKALGQYAKPVVVQVLIGALNDRDFGVVLASHHSLYILTGQNFGANSEDWLHWVEGHNNQLFEDQRAYTYKPYTKPKGLMDKIKFWKQDEPIKPLVPKGLDTQTSNAVDRPPSY